MISRNDYMLVDGITLIPRSLADEGSKFPPGLAGSVKRQVPFKKYESEVSKDLWDCINKTICDLDKLPAPTENFIIKLLPLPFIRVNFTYEDIISYNCQRDDIMKKAFEDLITKTITRLKNSEYIPDSELIELEKNSHFAKEESTLVLPRIIENLIDKSDICHIQVCSSFGQDGSKEKNLRCEVSGLYKDQLRATTSRFGLISEFWRRIVYKQNGKLYQSKLTRTEDSFNEEQRKEIVIRI